jgi:hypothetical protein
MKEVVEKILDSTLRHFRGNCPLDITDLVFLEIEKSFLSKYEGAVKYKGADSINKFIGKLVREYWNLKNEGRCNTPKSKLITSYEKHSNY